MSMDERVALLEDRLKDLTELILYIAKEAHVLPPGLVDRSLNSLQRYYNKRPED